MGLSGNRCLLWMTGNSSEVVLSDKDKKRPSDNESCLQASKRPKQVDQHLQASSFEEICTSATQLSPGTRLFYVKHDSKRMCDYKTCSFRCF